MSNSLRFAISILTTFPSGRIERIDEQLWRRSVYFYPLCGYILAAASIIPVMAVSKIIDVPDIIQSIAIIVLLALFTGGIHLDGFADVCDAFFCSAQRDRRVQILHDSRLGTFGVAGLSLLLISKVSAVTLLICKNDYMGIFAMIVIARFFMVVLVKVGRYFPYEMGMGKEIIGKIPYIAVLVPLIYTVPCFIRRFDIMFIIAILFFAVLFFNRKSNQKLGGISGDILGASCELCETLGLVLLTIGK